MTTTTSTTIELTKGDKIVLSKHGSRCGHLTMFMDAEVTKVTPTGIVRAKAGDYEFTLDRHWSGRWNVGAKTPWGKDDRWTFSNEEARQRQNAELAERRTRNEIAAELVNLAGRLRDGGEKVALFADLQAQLYKLLEALPD